MTFETRGLFPKKVKKMCKIMDSGLNNIYILISIYLLLLTEIVIIISLRPVSLLVNYFYLNLSGKLNILYIIIKYYLNNTSQINVINIYLCNQNFSILIPVYLYLDIFLIDNCNIYLKKQTIIIFVDYLCTLLNF